MPSTWIWDKSIQTMTTIKTRYPGFLTTQEAANLVQRSAQTIVNWCKQERFPCRRMGTGPRQINLEEFLAFMRENGFTVPGESVGE